MVIRKATRPDREVLGRLGALLMTVDVVEVQGNAPAQQLFRHAGFRWLKATDLGLSIQSGLCKKKSVG